MSDHDYESESAARWNTYLRDPETSDRWTKVVSHVALTLQEAYGITVSSNDVARLGLARVAALSGDMEVLEGIEREAASLPVVKAALAAAEKRAAIEAGDEDSIAELRKLTPSARIARARELGLVNGSDSIPTSMSDREELAQILTLRPAARVAMARRKGHI